MKYYLIFIAVIFLCYNYKSYGQEKSEKTILYGSNASVGKYAEIGELKLYYEIYGKGSPLLMIHGGLGSISDYQKSISELSNHFQVIAVDSRGHGRSSNPTDSLSYELLTDDMIDFLDYLKIDSVNIVGFSDGGVVGLYMATKYPERVIKVVASGANYLVEGMNSLEFPEVMMSSENVKSLDFWKHFRQEYSEKNPNPEKFDSHIQATRKMWLTDPYIPLNHLIKISDPILLVYGDRDVISLEHAIEMYRLLTPETTQLCIFPNTDHFVFEKKSKEVNQVIIDFVK